MSLYILVNLKNTFFVLNIYKIYFIFNEKKIKLNEKLETAITKNY